MASNQGFMLSHFAGGASQLIVGSGDAAEAAGAEPDGLAQIRRRFVDLIRRLLLPRAENSMHWLVHNL
jgi:hypothetical protein